METTNRQLPNYYCFVFIPATTLHYGDSCTTLAAAKCMTHMSQHSPTCHIPCKSIKQNASNCELIARGHKAHELTKPLEFTYAHKFCQRVNILKNVNFLQYHLSILFHAPNEMVLDQYALSSHEGSSSWPNK